MIISIKIEDIEAIEDIKSVGAKDLLEYFLPKVGIKAAKVRMSERTEEQTQRMRKGEKYTFWEDVHKAKDHQ
tara:strand:+ start:491 stop:706 length:216 start_codon:yes stop_codon:yes gene_type:complete